MAKKNYVLGGIGKASLALREECAWTQTDLAKRLGCSFGTISRWERQPTANMVVRKDIAGKFLALYNKRVPKRNRLALASVEFNEAELIEGVALGSV